VQGTAVGTSPLAPFDSVDVPHPNSREQLAEALRQRGFLPADAPAGTTLNGPIMAFQRSEGLPQTGFPDDATLSRLGIDPATKDRTLDTRSPWLPGATGAGVSH
jgi:peptidoglycan hydrolase-like protein with peptidoglycan-binding domain